MGPQYFIVRSTGSSLKIICVIHSFIIRDIRGYFVNYKNYMKFYLLTKQFNRNQFNIFDVGLQVTAINAQNNSNKKFFWRIL